MKKTKISKNVPLGIKILAILNWAAGAILIFVSLLLVFEFNFSDIASNSMSESFLLLSLFWMFLGILFVLVGRGLWKGKNWARIVEILLAVYSIASTFIDIFLGHFRTGLILNFAVAGLVLWYLLLNKEIKKFFNK